MIDDSREVQKSCHCDEEESLSLEDVAAVAAVVVVVERHEYQDAWDDGLTTPWFACY